MLINDINVTTEYKDIKHVYINVLPPHGEVKASAPKGMSEEMLRLYIIKNMPWIKQEQQKFFKQRRQQKRSMIDGEDHYLLGKRYRLKVITGKRKHQIVLSPSQYMELHIQQNTSLENKTKILEKYYRKELEKVLLPLVSKWEAILNIKASFIGIKRMRTKWGSCCHHNQRIWFNSELAKKPIECIEYIVVHELIHILENSHNQRFIYLLNKYMPNWQIYKHKLSQEYLAHETWKFKHSNENN